MTGSGLVAVLFASQHRIAQRGSILLVGAWLILLIPSIALSESIGAKVAEGDRAYQRGDYLAAEQLLEQAIASVEASNGAAVRVADLSMKLARVLRAQGRLSDAKPLLERILVIRIKQLGEDDPRTKEAKYALRNLVSAFGGHLHEASRRGDLAAVQRFLASQPDALSKRNGNGDTPLHAAAENGHKAIVEFLIARGADLRATNKAGVTPLHSAAMARRLSDVAEISVGLGMPIDRLDLMGAPLTPEKVSQLCRIVSCNELPLDDGFDDEFAGTEYPNDVRQSKAAIIRLLLNAGSSTSAGASHA